MLAHPIIAALSRMGVEVQPSQMREMGIPVHNDIGGYSTLMAFLDRKPSSLSLTVSPAHLARGETSIIPLA